MSTLKDIRLGAASATITTYSKAKPTDPEDILTDLLADLMHWAGHSGQDFDAALRKAKGHFLVETLPRAGYVARPRPAP